MEALDASMDFRFQPNFSWFHKAGFRLQSEERPKCVAHMCITRPAA